MSKAGRKAFKEEKRRSDEGWKRKSAERRAFGRQFIAEAFQKLCNSQDIVHVRISPHRPATNGVAERFIRRLKEMLSEREWINVEELKTILHEVIKEYNDTPHQGLDGLSPNEYERRLKVVPSH